VANIALPVVDEVVGVADTPVPKEVGPWPGRGVLGLPWAPSMWAAVGLGGTCAQPQAGHREAAQQQRPGDDRLHVVGGVHGGLFRCSSGRTLLPATCEILAFAWGYRSQTLGRVWWPVTSKSDEQSPALRGVRLDCQAPPQQRQPRSDVPNLSSTMGSSRYEPSAFPERTGKGCGGRLGGLGDGANGDVGWGVFRLLSAQDRIRRNMRVTDSNEYHCAAPAFCLR
jgi:hypothetical protein